MIGPGYGYHQKVNKSWLLVKEAAGEEAKRVFTQTGVQLTTKGTAPLAARIVEQDAIRLQFIPGLTGRSPSGNEERDLPRFTTETWRLRHCEPKQANSQHVTAPLAACIVEQDESIADIQTEN